MNRPAPGNPRQEGHVMRSIVLSGMWLTLATSAASSQTTDKSAVIDQLRVCYEKQTAPPWADAVKNLAAADVGRRATAAAYLVRLLDQAQTDELSGTAPWPATPCGEIRLHRCLH